VGKTHDVITEYKVFQRFYFYNSELILAVTEQAILNLPTITWMLPFMCTH